jgi:hypothetical protein
MIYKANIDVTIFKIFCFNDNCRNSYNIDNAQITNTNNKTATFIYDIPIS